MNRVYNFNPGPAALPLEVLERAQEELVNYHGVGMSLMEMSHRSKAFEALNEVTQHLLTEMLELPVGYHVLFMGGGASTQFALVPMNLLLPGKSASYIITGSFAEKAYREAQFVGDAVAAVRMQEKGWSRLPDHIEQLPWEVNTAYVHMTTNNTIEGSQFREIPRIHPIPLIGDLTSDLMGRRIDIGEFAMFYASAQKNLGPAGVTVVCIREELLQKCSKDIPVILRYETYASQKSLYNTPPVHSIYMMNLMLKWTREQGGLDEMERRNRLKSALIYGAIDASGGFYRGVVDQPYRSMMNMTWRIADEKLESLFIAESVKSGFDGLAGHRSVGGLRASAYNAVSVEACRALADFMADFQKRFG
jgi:phosphoserine aminotransferase